MGDLFHPLETHAFFSPGSNPALDEFAADSRFIELQEELRSTVFAGVSSLTPSKQVTPEPTDSNNEKQTQALPHRRNVDFSRVSIPKLKLVRYLQNWIVECAPFLDKFDAARHFGIHVPLMAQSSPAILYAILAFSARQMERKACTKKDYDSLELYQESIRLLGPGLQTRDPNMLVTACILAVLELMSGSSKSWRRHIEGCATLFEFFQVNGFSGGALQAVFWCYARMELCGAVVSAGRETTVLSLDKWTPPMPAGVTLTLADHARDAFLQASRVTPDMHANWSVYLCTKVCDLRYRWTRSLALNYREQQQHGFAEEWSIMWHDLQFWLHHRPQVLLPAKETEIRDQVFPCILFTHWAAISSNQLYHAACILMLEMKPPETLLPLSSSAPEYSSRVWHSRRICGISSTNPHQGNLINSIQPLYIAGRILTHPAEHLEVGRLFKVIETTTGWGALWRLRDLELEWGYEVGEVLRMI